MATPLDAPKKNTNTHFLFGKENYMIIIGGVLVLITGYFLMSGGRQKPDEYNVEEIYGFWRVTVAPVVVILGYVIVIFGILRKPKE